MRMENLLERGLGALLRPSACSFAGSTNYNGRRQDTARIARAAHRPRRPTPASASPDISPGHPRLLAGASVQPIQGRLSLHPNWIWGHSDSGGSWPVISGMPVLTIE